MAGARAIQALAREGNKATGLRRKRRPDFSGERMASDPFLVILGSIVAFALFAAACCIGLLYCLCRIYGIDFGEILRMATKDMIDKYTR
jgi:hypothetical protein